MAKVLDITKEKVTIGDGSKIIFDSDRSYLFKDTNPTSSFQQDKLFTKILNLNNKQIVPENNSIQNLQLQYNSLDWGEVTQAGRDSFPPAPSISKPFLEFYTYNGSPETRYYCFLLLIDISPVRQGFYEFTMGENKFYGFVRKLSKYDHYNWGLTAQGKYSWIKQSQPLGYGIEIAPADLYYNYSIPDPTGQDQNVALIAEKPLLSFLRNLTGGEEIISSISPVNPSIFNKGILNLPIGFVTNPAAGLVFSYSEGYDLLKISPTDAVCYIASYSDLIEKYKDLSQAQLIAAGQNEYDTNANSQGRTITFNPLAYINKYSDIKQTYAIGNNIDFLGAAEHFIKVGFSEGRNITNSSSLYTNSRAALYDERSNSIDLEDNVLVYPNGQTIAGKGKSLTYKFNNTVYFLNNNIPVNETPIFLRKQ